LSGLARRAFRYADFGVPDEHTTLLDSSGAYLYANPETAAALSPRPSGATPLPGIAPRQLPDIITTANADVLTDRDCCLAQGVGGVEGHYLRTGDGVLGTLDRQEASISKPGCKEGNGDALTVAPNFSTSYTNAYTTKDR